MQLISGSIVDDNRVWWCQRCGTLKDGGVSKPQLVNFVRKFCGTLNDDEPEDRMIATALKTAGVIEAIGKVDQE